MAKGKKAVQPEIGLVTCAEPGCEAGVHPVDVFVNRGGEITVIDWRGTTIQQGSPAGRGALIVNSFVCEAGHAFWVEFHFHKGVTTFGIHRNPIMDPADFNGPPTLWRN